MDGVESPDRLGWKRSARALGHRSVQLEDQPMVGCAAEHRPLLAGRSLRQEALRDGAHQRAIALDRRERRGEKELGVGERAADVLGARLAQ
jgi:hypothetical protein